MKLSIKAISAASLLATGTICQTSFAQSQSVTIGWFGGNWGETFNECVAKPFTQATGIKVVPEIGTSTVNLAKVEQQKSAPVIDAVWMDGGVSEMAMAADLLEPLSPQKIPNLKNVLTEGIYQYKGSTMAVSTGFYSVGLVYNTKEVKNPPKSWNDLWNPEFADAVTFPAPANALGIPSVYFLNVARNQPDGLDGTYKKLKTLKAALFYESSGAAANALQRGEVTVAVFNSSPAWELHDRGLPLQFVVPREGAWGGDVRLHLVKNAKNKDAAEKFINMALTPEASACLAQRLYLGPSIKDTKVDAEVAGKLPWGATGSVRDLKFLDWWEVNKQRASMVDRWNREIARK
jgi:putative spermidine/putrescine transport system substrate-binding protein